MALKQKEGTYHPSHFIINSINPIASKHLHSSSDDSECTHHGHVHSRELDIVKSKHTSKKPVAKFKPVIEVRDC